MRERETETETETHTHTQAHTGALTHPLSSPFAPSPGSGSDAADVYYVAAAQFFNPKVAIYQFNSNNTFLQSFVVDDKCGSTEDLHVSNRQYNCVCVCVCVCTYKQLCLDPSAHRCAPSCFFLLFR